MISSRATVSLLAAVAVSLAVGACGGSETTDTPAPVASGSDTTRPAQQQAEALSAQQARKQAQRALQRDSDVLPEQVASSRQMTELVSRAANYAAANPGQRDEAALAERFSGWSEVQFSVAAKARRGAGAVNVSQGVVTVTATDLAGDTHTRRVSADGTKIEFEDLPTPSRPDSTVTPAAPADVMQTLTAADRRRLAALRRREANRRRARIDDQQPPAAFETSRTPPPGAVPIDEMDFGNGGPTRAQIERRIAARQQRAAQRQAERQAERRAQAEAERQAERQQRPQADDGARAGGQEP